MKKKLAIVLMLIAFPTVAIELDDKYALAGDRSTAICITMNAVEKWYALASAKRGDEALAMPECILLHEGDKVLIVKRDVAGFTLGIWTAPNGSSIDVWMISSPNMTEWDFSVFYCNNRMPKCTRDVFEAVTKVLPGQYGDWKPSE